MDLRVAPNFASFSVAGFTKCRVAPALRSSCSACDVGLRLPLVLHLRLYRRFDLRVSPNLSSFGGADWPTSGFPLRSVLRYRRRSVFQIPLFRFARIANLPAPAGGRPSFPGVAPSVFAIVESSGRPESSSLARRRANFQVALNLRSLGVCRWSDLRVAPNLIPSAVPSMFSRVAPIPHLRRGR